MPGCKKQRQPDQAAILQYATLKLATMKRPVALEDYDHETHGIMLHFKHLFSTAGCAYLSDESNTASDTSCNRTRAIFSFSDGGSAFCALKLIAGLAA